MISQKKFKPRDNNSSEMNDTCSTSEEETDETFVALQKLFHAMNKGKGQNGPNIAPSMLSTSTFTATCTTAQKNAAGSTSREQLLENRRRERERFRRLVLSRTRQSSSRRSRSSSIHEDEEVEEERRQSVESQLCSRFRTGSFSVHVISRDRWNKEEQERLPIIYRPKNAKFISLALNSKLNEQRTPEFIELKNSLPENCTFGSKCLLTPPRTTWYIQMHNIEPSKWTQKVTNINEVNLYF